jgi:prepilin-type N-terminal cleavage/methylation domain-containing protein
MADKKNERGFSLIEGLIALTLLGLVLGALGEIFLSQAATYKGQARLVERQQGLRAALEIIARDCRSAGYPVLDDPFWANLGSWIPGGFLPKAPLTVVLSGMLTVTDGGSGPDVLSIATVIPNENNPARLAAPVSAGETTVRLDLTASQIDDQFNVGDLLYLGKPSEPALITGISGQVLTIDTDPSQPGNQGWKNSYPAGTEAGEISLISYAVFTDDNDPGARYHDPGIPVLKRKINAGGFEPLGEEITDLQVTALSADLFGLRLSMATGLERNRIRAGQGNILTLTTQIKKRN